MANPSIVVDFLANTAKLVAGMGDIGKAGEQAGKGFDVKKVAGYAAATAAVAAGAVYLKKASDATTDLTKSTISLQRVTNLETETASAWISSLQVRGIEASNFQTMLGRLAKNMETARSKTNDASGKIREIGNEMAAVRAKGGKDMPDDLEKLAAKMAKARAELEKSRGPFRDLDINWRQLKAGNIQAVILQAADAISKMESPTKRAAAAQALFGKQGLKLLPILMKGSKGIEENLKQAEKYGAVVGDKQVAQTKKVIESQRQLALAHKGVQVAIGSALLPAQVELYGSLLNIVQAVLPFVDNVNVMKGALIAWAVALGVLKVATIASTIAQLGLNAAMLPTIATVAGIVVAIAALIAIGVLLYKNWDKIAALAGTVWGKVKSAAQDAFNWIKSNWPLLLPILLGPIGVAAALIIRHWQQIKAAVTTALNAIKSAVQTAWNAIVGIVTATGNAIRAAVVTAWNATRAAVSAALNAIRSAVTAGFNAVVSVVRTAMNALVSAIRGAIGKARSAAQAIANAVKAVFAGAAGWLVAAGRAVVEGFARGIESALGRVRDAAAKIADAAKSVITGPVGFLTRSPSRWAHQQGEWVAIGLANGIVAATPLSEKAAKALAQRTMNAAKTQIQTLAADLQGLLSQAFAARQQAVQTPAEKALQAMQDARDRTQREQALADAQAQIAAAQTAEELLNAQRAYADAAYAIEVARLQEQARLERIQLEGQQAMQQRAFDNALKSLQRYLESGHATAKGARTRINALMQQYGLDFATIGDLLGASLAKGIEGSIDKAVKAANKLTKAVKDAVHAGLKIGSPSKVMQNAGAEVSRGLALGITRNAGLVSNAMRALIPTTAMLGSAEAQIQTATGPISVRVFIGDQELRGMVRTEIVNDNTGLARRLLAGSR